MDEDYHKSGLYRWQRQAKPRVYSRSQKVTTTDDIQHWMQKVEEASSKATEAVLGTEASSPYSVGRRRGRATVQGVSDQARIQDEAYTEAQDLLKEWISEKVSLHDNEAEDGLDLDEDDPWRKEELGLKARREWDNLLNGNLEELGIDTAPTLFKRQKDEDDPYTDLYSLEEGEAVSVVMHNMLNKDLVKGKVRNDLGFDDDSKSHDPRTKMVLRQQKVKENREKREQELKRRRQEMESKKQARLTARQIVMKEEKEKELKTRREEQQIKKQMAVIRKEMQEARKQEAEDRWRKQQETEEKSSLARQELERQEALEREEMLRRQHEISEKKKIEMAQREMQKARQAAENLRTLHKHFSAWYDIVLYRRLCFGKARALSDWRLTLRIWNAWRSYVRSQRITMETKQHEFNVVEENRKAIVATKHHYLHQLHRCFSAWRNFVSQEQDKRHLEQAQESTRSKMMNLLAAVAEGSLRNAGQGQDGKKEDAGKTGGRGGGHGKAGSVVAQRGGENTAREVDAIFSQPCRRVAWEEESDASPFPSSRPESSLSSASTTRVRGQGHRTPSQAWQITRKHAQLTKEELAQFMHGGHQDIDDGSEVSSEHSDVKIRRRFGTQPWMNRHYTVNNFEHRFTAQQRLLKEQQSEIKEQKRMIQELMYAQQQQEHRQTLAQLSPEKQGAVGSPAKEALPDGNGDRTRGQKDKTTSRPVPSDQTLVKPSGDINHSPESRDTDRSEVSTARSGQTSSEVTTTSAATSNTHNSKYLRVLKNMEERAAERGRLKAEREEKRRKAEDERLERLKAEEEELKRRAEEEKQARVQAYREKKRLEKQKEQEKQRELELQREQNKKAEDHYLKALMKFRVLVPMKKLVQMAHEKLERAEQHHDHQILRRVISAWKQHTDELTAEKKQLADDLHGYIVVRRCFQSWKNFKYRMIFLERRAERHHKDLILPKMFEAWRLYTAEEKLEEQKRIQLADQFCPKSIMRMVFHAWQRLPRELRREAEREKLRAEMRKKVADLLPDFSPSLSVSQSRDSTL